jgi:uncharacterized Fe-S radical SAM superfamily protein PflX
MVRPGDLRKMFTEMDDEEPRVAVMAKNLGSATNLYAFQKKLANYKDKKIPNYLIAVKNARPMLYERVLNKARTLPNRILASGKQISNSVSQNSSPKELFNAMKKLNGLKSAHEKTKTLASPFATKNVTPIGNVKFTQNQMAEDLAKSRNWTNYSKKALLYQGQANYSKAVVDAKAVLSNRVKKRYEELTKKQQEQTQKYANVAGMNKSSSPENLLNALAEMRRFKRPFMTRKQT